MKAILLPRSPHHHEWCGPFGDGLKRHGWTVEVANQWRPCDLLVCWGVRRPNDMGAQRRHGGDICILERGYLGDRFQWTSVSFGGGLNGRGEFRGVRSDPERFDDHFGSLKRWKRQEGYALIIGQVPGDMSLEPVRGSLDAWCGQVAAALRDKGHDVRFRPHPEAVKRGKGGSIPGVPTLIGDLQSALAGASLVVTFNSNTAVDSVIAGVPTVAMDRGSMAWPVTTHFFETESQTPDRHVWAAELAWKQFTMAEMASGFCWEIVGQRIEAAA
jgi:hypothetical protein